MAVKKSAMRNGAHMGRAGVIIPLLVMCGLLATACGSESSPPGVSSQSPSPGKSPGSPTAPEATAPARGATQTVHLGRFTEIFDSPLPADPAQASVVEGFRTAMILWDKSINAFAPVGLVAAYVEGHAMHELASSIASDKSYDTVLSGTDRFFKTRVTMHSAASATITTCDDASKFELVNRETGIVDPNFSNPPDQQYMFYTFQMIQQHGHWAISDASGVTLPDPRAIPCQPLRTPPIA